MAVGIAVLVLNTGVGAVPYDLGLVPWIHPVVIQNPDYPESPAGSGQHPCTIWVPTPLAVTAYKNNSAFSESPLVTQGIPTAELADVVNQTSVYGYKTSTKPPRYLPSMDYSSYGESPIYPFVGQMVPGTDVQYTTPGVPALWLVDTKDVNGDGTDEVIPALTTVDFRKFLSINWPRQRYVSAIEKARRGEADEILFCGEEVAHNKTVGSSSGRIVRVNGDYKMNNCATINSFVFTILPGTTFVMNDQQPNACDNGAPESITYTEFQLWTNVNADGTEQRPIIFTSMALVPRPRDWDKIMIGNPWVTGLRENFLLVEYARTGIDIDVPSNPIIQNNIVRYGELDGVQGGSFGIYSRNASTIQDNEIHNFSVSLSTSGIHDIVIRHNTAYNNTLGDGHNTKGIQTDFDNGAGLREAYYNTIIKTSWGGIAIEGTIDDRVYFHHNISCMNKVTVGAITYSAPGIMLYHSPADGDNPRLESNDSWGNYCSWVTNAQDNPANMVEGSEIQGHYITHRYDATNLSANPLFRNPVLFDLTHDLDNDDLFSDQERKLGTNPWIADTDHDGLNDGDEVNRYHSDPLNPDSNGNGYLDGFEVQLGLDPTKPNEIHVPAVTTSGLFALAMMMVGLGILVFGKRHRAEKRRIE